MDISRGQFLRKLGVSMAGAALGTGLMQSAAQAVEIRRATPVGAGAPKPDPSNQKVTWLNSGPGFGNRVSLTFDDGPTPGITDRVLKDLRERDIRATFFVIGKKVTAHPEFLQQAVAEGHEIANHTYTHPKLSSLSSGRVERELHQCQEAVAKAIGYEPVWFRPPYGAFRRNQGSMAVQEGLGVLMWSVDPRDWANPGVKTIAQRVLKSTQPGSVILLHDLKRQTADALPYILDGLMARNYEFTNISGFLGRPYPVA